MKVNVVSKKSGSIMKNCLLKKTIILISFFTCSLFGYQYDLAIASIFQQEARFMKEWIEFHRLIGVQHFYLYNDNSSDNFKEILDPYIKAGIVELYDYPRNEKNFFLHQVSAFDDALHKATGLVKWLAIIDLDEFIVPVKNDNLIDFLKNFEEYGGVCLNWLMFGTSSISKIEPNELMINKLIMCSGQTWWGHLKSIVRPERVQGIHHAHIATYKPGFFQVSANKIRFEGAFFDGPLDEIRINHYWTRDCYNMITKKIPRYISFAPKDDYGMQLWKIHEAIEIVKKTNVAKDQAILKYSAKLEKMMNSQLTP